MITMGIDCASKKTGIAILSKDKLLYSELHESGLPANASDKELAKALSLLRSKLIRLSRKYKPEKIVVELTGVTRNANTMRLIAYFEAMAILAARETGADIERIRTTSVRKKVFGYGNIDKQDVVRKVVKKYGELSEDESEAIVFALHGNGLEL